MTFVAFVVFGAIPLLPYIVGVEANARFTVAAVSTMVALLCLGFTRSYVTRERLVRGPLEIAGVGALGAVIAYVVGVLLRQLATGIV